MNQGFEISSWQVVAMLLAAVISAFAAWWRLREGSVRMSQRREQHLRKLLEKKQSLLKVPPLLLQMNLRQAFGRSMDEREFVFIQTRHNPMLLLTTRLAAEDFVRLSANGDGYEDARTRRALPWISLDRLSWFFLISGIIFLGPLLVFAVIAWSHGPISGVLATLEVLAMEWICVYAAAKSQAASRMLNFEERHPALGAAWKPKRGSKSDDDLPIAPSAAP